MMNLIYIFSTCQTTELQQMVFFAATKLKLVKTNKALEKKYWIKLDAKKIKTEAELTQERDDRKSTNCCHRNDNLQAHKNDNLQAQEPGILLANS
jgi:hypothetical protein